jgi:hypothetical protein
LAASFNEMPPLAYQSNNLATMGATAVSTAMIFLPSGPMMLR